MAVRQSVCHRLAVADGRFTSQAWVSMPSAGLQMYESNRRAFSDTPLVQPPSPDSCDAQFHEQHRNHWFGCSHSQQWHLTRQGKCSPHPMMCEVCCDVFWDMIGEEHSLLVLKGIDQRSNGPF